MPVNLPEKALSRFIEATSRVKVTITSQVLIILIYKKLNGFKQQCAVNWDEETIGCVF